MNSLKRRSTKYLARILGLFGFMLILSSFAFAAPAIVSVDSNTTTIDLTDFGSTQKLPESKLLIAGPGDTEKVSITAKGLGPIYFWSLYSFRNTSSTDLDFVLAIEPQRFAGSGILKLQPFGNSVLAAASTKNPDVLHPFVAVDQKAYSFRISAGQTHNIAVETDGTKLRPSLWQRHVLDVHLGNLSFFRGLVLGISLLVTLGVLALYGFRPHSALLSGWLFCVSSLLFLTFEMGYVSGAIQQLARFNLSPSTLRALFETLMSIALLSCALTFTGIRKRQPVVGILLLLMLVALLGNMIFAFVEPNQAATAARLSFVAVILIGFAVTALNRNSTTGIVDSGLAFWLSTAAWAIVAAIFTQSESRTASLSPVLLGLLAALLIVLAMVLMRFIFTQGLSIKPFITDASRRSLALSSARHVLWDWQIEDQFLDIGKELPKALGYDAQSWNLNSQRNFLDIMHPVDAAAYQNELEPDNLQLGHHVDVDLRLRNAAGDYRWYELRSRVVPGPNQMPDRCIGTLTDVTKVKETEERLITDAVHDPVTGLPSRAIFMDRLERELMKPLGFQVRLVLIDLDRLKTLNEALGHDHGDRLLQLAGARIQGCLTGDESVSRISGSQFAVMAVEAIAQRNANDLAEIISDVLAEPTAMGNHEITLAASIGISNVSERGVTAADLQQQAASALLEARRLGGARIVLFDTDLKDERSTHLALESDLRRAISNNEIEVQFQPISNLRTLEIAGFEALARWRHPKKGLLPPGDFIDMAENAGMIGEIGQIVLANAARHLGVWQRVLRRDENFFVAVNISPSHLLESNFLEQVQAIIERESLKPNSLKIEVTESVIMRHPDRATKLFERLRSLGVGLACDDFGTGFSNLSSLRDLPFDTLKIDRSFLTPESFDTRSGMIITTITELAHGLGMVVVAEGVESQAQINRLAELGCDLGQGFHIGEPKSANEVSELLAILPRMAATPSPPPPPLAEILLPVVFYKAPPAQLNANHLWPSVESLTPKPGRAPMAPRPKVQVEPELEVLPSIFSIGGGPTTLKSKQKKPAKRAKKD